MRKIFLTTLFAILTLCVYSKKHPKTTASTFINAEDLKEFYTHLANQIKYPIKAQQGNLQGNSIILFTVVDGKLKDLKIENELGGDCDTEVLNNILSFTNFKDMKPGNYALKTIFKLVGSNSKIINEDSSIPLNYIALNLSITAYAPTTAIKTGSTNKRLFNTTDPLIILDDKIITSPLNSISPETIESIVVLKDLNAISKYGDEGKNGVLIITTKKASDKQEPSQKPKQ